MNLLSPDLDSLHRRQLLQPGLPGVHSIAPLGAGRQLWRGLLRRPPLTDDGVSVRHRKLVVGLEDRTEPLF